MNAPLPRPTVSAFSLHRHQVLDVVLAARCGVEYQPLVSCSTERTIGYEALARFCLADGTPIAPDTLFERLHEEPSLLYHLEREAKRCQLAHCPEDGLIFINLDPDSFEAGDTDFPGGNTFIEQFNASGLGDRLVVEVIENLHLRDVTLSRRMIDALTGGGYKVAMDDLAVSKGLLSFGSLADSAYLKFDLSWLAERDRPRREAILEWSLSAARALSVITVLEGVEDEDDLAFARRLGFDLVQGFRYRERFIRIPPPQI